jgi:hypothetical protein
VNFGQLFADHFLREGIRTTTAYERLVAAEDLLPALREALVAAFDGFPHATQPDEASTEQDLIFRVLEALGWHRDAWQVQPRASRQGRADVPDMLLFPDAAAKRAANAEPSQERRYRHGVAVVENKRWNRPLDHAARGVRAAADEREVPSTQMLRYLSRADTLSERKIQFGILTNGRLWRLYYQGAKSRSEEYLEVDLPSLLSLATMPPDLLAPPTAERDHWLRVFLLMFGRESFVAAGDGGRTFHLLALDEGRLWEEAVARDLSRLIFREVFPALVRALDAGDRQRPAPRTSGYLVELKEAALTLLYRLLFVLYAEDRDLLPVRDLRYDDYGLRAIRHDIARRTDRGDTFSAAIAAYQARLRGLFNAIARGEATLGLPPYDGGLFDLERVPLLERAELPDARLAPVLDRLSRLDGEAGRRWINYRDLSVQQLGSIYEGLLEYEVAVADDDTVRVVDDDAGRRASGSFYTPETLVQLILERAVGPLVGERLAAFAAAAEALRDDTRAKAERLAALRDLDPASRLLDVKVCDPAMGSGHFLVSLVDYLADRVLLAVAEAPRLVPFADEGSPYRSPLIERIERTRRRVLDHARAQGWHVEEHQLDDRRLVRRMVLKRVVHGVDKNPMAVELAKVALWLHTFTAGAPLSFLDHHFRCGDSLLGLWVSDANRWLAERGDLIVNRHVVRVQEAAGAMLRVEEIADADLAEARDSAAIFADMEAATGPLAALLSLLEGERLMGVLDAAPRERPSESRRTTRHEAKLAAWDRARAFNHILDGTFGDPVAVARAEVEILPRTPPGQLGPSAPPAPDQSSLFPGSAMDGAQRALAQAILDEARELARRHRFTHWQLAFPNVWRDWSGAGALGGFDAVIGNPPYVRQEQLGAVKPALAKAYRAFDGVVDLYVYFYELGLRLLRPGGRLSFVVTNKWLRAGYAERLRGLFADEAWLEAVIDFGHAKGFFPAADVFPCVVVARRPDAGEPPEQTAACQIPRDLVRLDRVSEQVAELSFPLPRAVFTRRAWVVERPAVGALLDKIRRAGAPLREAAGVSPLYGIKTGCNEAFLVDTPTRDALVAADPGCAEIVRPYLRGQDIDRWHAPWAGLWMIFARRGIQIERYPSVLAHLSRFRQQLEPRPTDWDGDPREWQGRKAGSYAWHELQDAVDYWERFAEPKIIYPDLSWSPSFAFSNRGELVNDLAFAIPTPDLTILAILNAPLTWWCLWRTTLHGKDEVLRLKSRYLEQVRIPVLEQEARERLTTISRRLIEIEVAAANTRQQLSDWYRAEHEIERPGRMLADPFTLDADRFVAEVRAVRGRRRPLTPAGVAAVREGWRETVAPIRERLREAEGLERELSDLVNAAYGLTPEEVRLMWETAPPRMPLASPREGTRPAAAA